ncbi:MAG: hypothetical protein K5780_03615 [Alphaproteobacteria bacterium]|nr:hypothetical protein [Alphaproteobacteria bacterium]
MKKTVFLLNFIVASVNVLFLIKSSSNGGINRKFKRFLFVMTSTREEVKKNIIFLKKASANFDKV